MNCQLSKWSESKVEIFKNETAIKTIIFAPIGPNCDGGNMTRNIVVDRTGQNGGDLVTFGAETGIFS